MKLQKKLIYLFAAALLFASGGCVPEEKIVMIFSEKDCPDGNNDEIYKCKVAPANFAWIHGTTGTSFDWNFNLPQAGAYVYQYGRGIGDYKHRAAWIDIHTVTRPSWDESKLLWQIRPVTITQDYIESLDPPIEDINVYLSLYGQNNVHERADIFYLDKLVFENVEYVKHENWIEIILNDEKETTLGVYIEDGVTPNPKKPQSLIDAAPKTVVLRGLYEIDGIKDECPVPTDTEEYICAYAHDLKYMPVHGSTLTFETTIGAKAYYKEVSGTPIVGEAQYIWSLVYDSTKSTEHYSSVTTYVYYYKLTINGVELDDLVTVSDHDTWLLVTTADDPSSQLIIKKP